MKKYLLKSLLLSLLAFNFFACSDDENELPESFKFSGNGFYILNQGDAKIDDAKLSVYDFENQKLTEDLFKKQNKIVLGNIAQDMLIYGSKMYISVTGSRRIYVTDLTGKLLKTVDNKDAIITLKPADIAQEPYSLIAHQGKVYATFYGGSIARIDTTSFNIEKTISNVGLYPERMVVVNNNLYVTNRSGYNIDPSTSIYRIDLTSFNSAIPITVGLNPTQILADKSGNLFVASAGNFKMPNETGYIAPTFQKIAANTTTSKEINDKNVISMALDKSKNRILLIYSTPEYIAKLAYYDLTKNEFVDKSFLEGEFSNPAYITINEKDNSIYLITSAYKEISKLHIFTSEGKHNKTIETGGDFPTGVYFVTKTIR